MDKEEILVFLAIIGILQMRLLRKMALKIVTNIENIKGFVNYTIITQWKIL